VTADEAIESAAASLAEIPGLHWDKAAWADFLASSPEAQHRDLLILASSAENPGADWADAVLNGLKDVLLVAGAISGVTGAVAGIQGIKW
jgi:hypothetical protein